MKISRKNKITFHDDILEILDMICGHCIKEVKSHVNMWLIQNDIKKLSDIDCWNNFEDNLNESGMLNDYLKAKNNSHSWHCIHAKVHDSFIPANLFIHPDLILVEIPIRNTTKLRIYRKNV